MMPLISEMLSEALRHHQAGRLPEAEALYRQILQTQPDHADALHLLGLIAHHGGRHEDAVELIGRAIAINSGVSVFFNNLGEAYRAMGRGEEAMNCYRCAIELEPGIPHPYNNLGTLLHQQGDLSGAITYYRQALAREPGFAEAYFNLANVVKDKGSLEEAETYYRQALAHKPAFSDAYINLGALLQAQHRSEEAMACYRQALALKPDFAEAYYNMGDLSRDEGNFEEAEALYRQALAFKPMCEDACLNLGNILHAQGRLEEEESHYRRFLAIKPDFSGAHNNLGIALKARGKLEEAEFHYRQALAIKPDFAEAYNNLADVLREQGKMDEAAAHYRRALALKPDFAEAENQLMLQLQLLCEWGELDNLIDRQRARLRSNSTARIYPFTLLSIPASPCEQLICARNWAAGCIAPVARLREGMGFRFPKTVKPRLRIGYLSADFRQHPVACLIAELFELHDRGCVDVFAYSIGPDDGSEMRNRLSRACDRFVDLAGASYKDAAHRIYEDGIDILIDLQGYTRLARTQILALRPAPIQANYLGYPGTMGADFMDYIITDRFITPLDQEPHFTEKLVYLPDCYQINDRQRRIADCVPSRTECGLPESGFVFCCLSNSFKITPDVFAVWMRLLKAVSGSVLWLLEANRAVASNLRREADGRGVAAERLIFAPRASMAEHLARLRVADLFLDTGPYNAHTTASDALWAGLPVLTCVGETFASRVAGSLLTAIGVPELITYSLEEYEATALRMARDPSELSGLRKRLAENRLTTPLFDSARYTRHLERAYQMMWETYLKGEALRRIEVPARRA